MSNKLPLSVHVLTWNSGKTLRACLAWVADIASEILVIDGGSTDDTIAIAKEFSATVVTQKGANGTPIRDFSAVRNQALEAATQPWVLALDSDEYASPELVEDIQRAIAAGKPVAALVPRKYVLSDGRVVRLATTYPNTRLYFFHRDAVTKWIKPVHERVELRSGAKVINFHGASLAPLGTIAQFKERNRRYLMIEHERSKNDSFGVWFRSKFLRTLVSRTYSFIKLLGIWLLARRGPRLPLKFELLRFWYGWKLIVATFPLWRR